MGLRHCKGAFAMKQFCILNENEYKDFQEKSAQRSFMNSIEAINLKKTNGWDVEYAGVKEDGRLSGWQD